MTIRLVISDIDGTLVRTDKTLSEANVSAIRHLTRIGLPVTLVSARPPSGMAWIIRRLDLPGPFAAFNGGVIFNRDGTVTAAHRINADVSQQLFSLFVKMGVMRWVFADGDWLANTVDALHTPREVKSSGIEPIVTDDVSSRLARADKLVAVSDDDALLTRVEVAACAIAGNRASIARSQPYYVDVTATEANKGNAVAMLAEIAGIPLADVAVLGDQNNDLPMFARAGYSIAMGQASDAVKSKAHAVSKTNDDDGVADAINSFVLPRV